VRERALKRENKGEEEEEGKIYIQGKKREREKKTLSSHLIRSNICPTSAYQVKQISMETLYSFKYKLFSSFTFSF
jgi:hypothetical protein